MKLIFSGAAQTVTGSCHILEVGNTRIMVDCGMYHGPRTIRERNYHSFPFEPGSIDFLLLTHAHIDHSGLIPKLYKHGFRGRVLATPATVDLCEVMLPDSGHIQEMEVERRNRKALRAGREIVAPIYTAEDARMCVQKFERVPYYEELRLTSRVSVRFLDAGHILGSSMIELIVINDNKKIKFIFTGDLGGESKPYVRDPDVPTDADYVIMESTYGGRLHRDKSNRLQKLKEVIDETYKKGGNLIIPAFAVERTQDLLYDINNLYITGEMPPMDVYIDSPMAVAATEVFKRHPEAFDEETMKLISSGKNPLTMPALRYSRTTEQSIELNKLKGGAIILSASGMCDAGRIKHHLKHNLWRPECTVLFVGYQAPGTKGQRLLDGVTSIRIHGEEVAVKADIRNIDGYSSHADQNSLIQWLDKFQTKPGKVFLVHGSSDALKALEEQITLQLGIQAYAPLWLETVELVKDMEVNAKEIMDSYNAFVSKLNNLLNTEPDNVLKTKLMERLRELESLVEGEQRL